MCKMTICNLISSPSSFPPRFLVRHIIYARHHGITKPSPPSPIANRRPPPPLPSSSSISGDWSSEMSTIGLDVGNETSVIATVNNSSVDIILNQDSNYETPSLVSFSPSQRHFGSAAANSSVMNSSLTISNIKRLIGRRFSDPLVQRELCRLPFPISEGSDGGVLIRVEHRQRQCIFTPVQVLAMLFSHLKQTAEAFVGSSVAECVIGIPSYFTDRQRRAYLDAADIAGLEPFRLMHDGAAIALGYGIYKKGIDSFTVVAFVDIGHSDTQICITMFEEWGMKTLAHASDPDLGGSDFDRLLFNHFARNFEDRFGVNVESSPRGKARLMAACVKLKKVLSANTEGQISIECLMDDKDVSGSITREEFERLSSGLLERIRFACEKALKDADFSVDRVQSVELVGSGSRIPAISRTVAGFFKREPNRTLNATECIARGCALQCAMLQHKFRTREYEVKDMNPYSVGFSIDEGPISSLSRSILFPKGHLMPSTKVVSFNRPTTFHLQAFYVDQNQQLSEKFEKICRFRIGPFLASENESPKVKVRIRLNLHGVVTIDFASLFRVPTGDQVLELESHTNGVPAKTELSNGDQRSRVDGDKHMTVSTSRSRCLPTTRDIEENADEMQRITISEIETCLSEDCFVGLSKKGMSEAKRQENELADQDRQVMQTKEKKNTLETYLFEIRRKLPERYRSFVSNREKEGITKHLEDTEQWLNDEGEDESLGVYSDKLEELKKLVDPIESRYQDEDDRALAIKELLTHIVDHKDEASSLAPSERNAVHQECDKYERLLRDKIRLQYGLPKNIDPVLWSSEIREMTDTLDVSCRNIRKAKSPPSKRRVFWRIRRTHSSFDKSGQDTTDTPRRICQCHFVDILQRKPSKRRHGHKI